MVNGLKMFFLLFINILQILQSVLQRITPTVCQSKILLYRLLFLCLIHKKIKVGC